MPPYTFYVGNFVHSKCLEKLDIFKGCVRVNHIGIIDCFAPRYKVEPSKIGPHGKLDQKAVDSELQYIPKEVLEALEKLDLEEKDAEKQVLKVLGREAKDTTIHIAREWQFFHPGLIDTHIHACQYPNSGLFGTGPLLQWLKEYTYKIEAKLKDPTLAKKVYSRCVRRTLSNGTTTAAYYATIDRDSTNILAQICHEAGQRAFVGRCNMDIASGPTLPKDLPPPDEGEVYADQDYATAVRDTKLCIEFIKKLDPNNNLITPVLTPRFAVNCSSELLMELGLLAESTKLPCQTHIAENKAEYAEVMKKHADINPDSYAHVYDYFGLLRPEMILAHAVHLNDCDIRRIKAKNAKIAHCPISNVALLSGNAKVRKMLDAGIVVGLGTDHAGGYSPSLLEVVRDATMVSRIVAVEEADKQASPWPPIEDYCNKPRNLPGEGEKPLNLPEGCDKPENLPGDPGDRKKSKTPGEPLLPEPEYREKLSVSEALYLATRGGAQVMGLENKVGHFAQWMEWDAVLVGLTRVSQSNEAEIGGSLSPVDIFGLGIEIHEDKDTDKIDKWVYSGDDRNFLKVWVQGRLVHEKPSGGHGGRGCSHCY